MHRFLFEAVLFSLFAAGEISNPVPLKPHQENDAALCSISFFIHFSVLIHEK